MILSQNQVGLDKKMYLKKEEDNMYALSAVTAPFYWFSS